MKPTDRLRRFVEESDELVETDVDERLAELQAIGERAGAEYGTEDVRVLSALANSTRYRIVRLLVAADDELCVCELLPLLDVSESATSHALSELTSAGLIQRRKEGKWRFYRATERAGDLIAALDASRGAK